MKTMQQWLDEYGSHHKNGTNKIIHWICVPLIFFSVVGLLYSVKFQFAILSFKINLHRLIQQPRLHVLSLATHFFKIAL